MATSILQLQNKIASKNRICGEMRFFFLTKGKRKKRSHKGRGQAKYRRIQTVSNCERGARNLLSFEESFCG